MGKLSRKLRHLAQHLPGGLRHSLMRRQIRVSYEPPPELTIKIAETLPEFEAAYRLLHGAYVDQGYMDPQPSGMRILKYFALPSTTTIIAKWNDQVIGTISVVRHTSLGLPLSKIFNYGSLVRKGLEVGEVSSLAVDKRYRNQPGLLFFIFHYYYKYVKHYMNLDAVVIAVNPSWQDFYQSILFFSALEDRQVDNYSFVKGAPAVGLFHQFAQLDENFKKHFAGRSPSNNLYQFFLESDFSCHRFPERWIARSQDPVMDLATMQTLFAEKSRVITEINQYERGTIAAQYPLGELRDFLLHGQKLEISRDVRHRVKIACHDMRGSTEILDLSQTGVKVRGVYRPQETLQLTLQEGLPQPLEIDVQVQWTDVLQRRSGLRVLGASPHWAALVNRLNDEFVLSSRREKTSLPKSA